jgi:hypothetical protein
MHHRTIMHTRWVDHVYTSNRTYKTCILKATRCRNLKKSHKLKVISWLQVSSPVRISDSYFTRLVKSKAEMLHTNATLIPCDTKFAHCLHGCSQYMRILHFKWEVPTRLVAHASCWIALFNQPDRITPWNYYTKHGAVI